MSYFTLRWLSKKCTLWRKQAPTIVRSVKSQPSPGLAAGAFFLLAVVGVGTWEPIPCKVPGVYSNSDVRRSSGDLLPPSPPAEQAATSIALTEFSRRECIFWTRPAGTCSSAPNICLLKPTATPTTAEPNQRPTKSSELISTRVQAISAAAKRR